MDRHKILIMDDEPHLLDWLEEYLSSKGCDCTFARNVDEAIEVLGRQRFRALILDLNVPAPGQYSSAIKEKGELYLTYRGLFVAEHARGLSYRGRQVILYSVHDIDEVRLQSNRLGVTYVTKGRPRIFKQEIDELLSYDPTENN